MANRTKQKNAFESLMQDQVEVKISDDVLANAMEFIADEFEPDEVYNMDKLREFVAKSSLPQDVFEEKELIEWAEENGYNKP